MIAVKVCSLAAYNTIYDMLASISGLRQEDPVRQRELVSKVSRQMPSPVTGPVSAAAENVVDLRKQERISQRDHR